MKLGIMQPYLFPYIGYFQLINAVDAYVIYDDVQYIKGGWINRNNILMQGDRKLFSIGLHEASPNKLINEISINDDFVKFEKTLSMVYSKAPYSGPALEVIRRIIGYEDRNLAHFSYNSLKEINAYLGITTKLVYSSDLHKDVALRAQDKVLAICKELGATTYLNAIGGQELYSRDAFAAQGITLQFLKTQPIEYKQYANEFVPWLSIIDVMMFNSPEEIKKLLDAYELI